MGYLLIKPASKNSQDGAGPTAQADELGGGRALSVGSLHPDSGNSSRDLRRSDGKL